MPDNLSYATLGGIDVAPPPHMVLRSGGVASWRREAEGKNTPLT
jgi:hypothetical protein